jgi:hypothetical protein
MIRISCTSCKAVLSVDDGFACGVCRCQHCGTIQVVPASLKPPIKPASPAPAKAPATKSSAPVVSISGAAASLAQKGISAPKDPPHAGAHLLKLGVVIAFILFLVLIAVIFIFLREG